MDVLETSKIQAPPMKKQRLEDDAQSPSHSAQDDFDDVYGEQSASIEMERKVLNEATSENQVATIPKSKSRSPDLSPSRPQAAISLPSTPKVNPNSPGTSFSKPEEEEPYCLPGLGGSMSVEHAPNGPKEPLPKHGDQSSHDIGEQPSELALSLRDAEDMEVSGGIGIESMEISHHSSLQDAQIQTAVPQASQGSIVTLEAESGPNGNEHQSVEQDLLSKESSQAAAKVNATNGSGLSLHETNPSQTPQEPETEALKSALHREDKTAGSQDLDLEAVFNQLSGSATSGTVQQSSNLQQEPPEAEYEEDSSPYQSSTDESSELSSDSSSNKDDESGDEYLMLDAAEAARRLLEDDGGSDDEGTKKGTANGHVKTTNEIIDETIEIPDVAITPEMEITELGSIETMIENTILVRGKTSGEYRVLDSGSLLCLDSRRVIGTVAETLGRVQQPLYSVRFPSMQMMTDFDLDKGVVIHYVPQHSVFVFTKALQGVKGSDASNLHDEEVGADEMEFSDDEAEAEYKKSMKFEKQAKKGGRQDQRNGHARGGRFGGRPQGPYPESPMQGASTATTLNYDETDEPYTRLTRPANLYQSTNSGSMEFPQETFEAGNRNLRGRRDRGRGSGHSKQRERPNRHPNSHSRVSQPDLSLPTPPKFSTPPSPRGQASAGSPNAPTQSPHPQSHYPQFPQAQPHQQPFHSPSYQAPSAPSPSFNGFYQPPAPPLSANGSHFPQHYHQGAQRQYSQAGHNGYSWQQQQQRPQQQQLPPSPMLPQPNVSPSGQTLPPGAFVNPAFFQQQFLPSNQSYYPGNNGTR